MKRHLLALLLTLIVALSGLSGAVVSAQEAASEGAAATAPIDPADLDYEAWEGVASRAETALQEARASNDAFEVLRADVVDWRSQFQAAQSANEQRIATLQAQIDALGPVPEEGGEEPEELASRRAELNDQMAELQAPARRADEAFQRADGLVREIDTLIRARQAEELTRLGPSPLNPAHWPSALSEISATVIAYQQELRDNWANPVIRQSARSNLAVIVVGTVLGLVLLLRGARWSDLAIARFAEPRAAYQRNVLEPLISLGRLLLPWIGLLALFEAAHASGLHGQYGDILVSSIPAVGLIILFANWLARRLLPPDGTGRKVFTLSGERARLVRWSLSGLGLLLAARVLLAVLSDYTGYSASTQAVLNFPLLVLGGLLLLELGRELTGQHRVASESGEVMPVRARLFGLIGRASTVFAVLGPLAGAIGLTQIAGYMIFSTSLTLMLLGGLILLQRFVTDVYALLTGSRDGADDALIPVLIGFFLTLLAVPLLSLIWGARVSDLTELWARFAAGFAVGDARISPLDFVAFAVVFALGYMATRLLQGALRGSILPRTRIDPGGQTAIVSGLGYVGIFLAALAAITAIGIDLSSLAIVAGALSVGIGFGLQTIVSNFVSGIILLIERPVSEGDWIEVGGVMGIVRRISVRSTRVETFDRTDVIVPNSDLIAGQVTNWTRSNTTGRLIIRVGVAYGTDTRKVQEVLQQIAAECPDVVQYPPPQVLFIGFGADALDFEMRVILNNIYDIMVVQTELNHQVARRFAEEGFEIPFAQRDIWLRNPEALGAAAAPVPPVPDPPEGQGGA